MNYGAIKFGLVALFALAVFVPTTLALGLSGAILIEEVSPGQEIIHEISVMGNKDEPVLNMTAEVSGFARSLDGVNIPLRPEDDTGPFSARPFLSVEPESFILEPGETETLLLTGTVPEDVGPGGRYALVTVATVPPEGEGVTVSFGIQTVVFLTIKGSELIKTGDITDLVASMVDGNVSVGLLFENTGNVHYKPLVGVNLLDIDGDIVANVELTETEGSILPTGSRLVKMTLVPDALLEPGTYTVEATVALDDGTVLDTAETTIEV